MGLSNLLKLVIMAEENSQTVTDAVPSTADGSDGSLRVYLGDEKKNLDCRFYENQVCSKLDVPPCFDRRIVILDYSFLISI